METAIIGKIKSFHLQIIDKIANTAIAGRARGKTIRQKILHSLAASILAASSSSSGIVSIYCLNMKTPVGVAAPGIITPHNVPDKPVTETILNIPTIRTEAGTIKVAKIISLSDDIARNTSSVSTRVSIIPGRNTIGIEIPNSKRDDVVLSEIIGSDSFQKKEIKLPIALGKSISGSPIVADLTSMPHLLIAGTTGSGKSVCINTIITSLLYKHSPDNCKLVLIDPKMLELSSYEGIPHLLSPVITDAKKATSALSWTVKELSLIHI